MSPKSFVKHLRRRGEAHNAEQLEALKTVFTSVTGDFYDVAKQVAAGDTDPQTLLKMAKAMNLAKGVLAQKAGAVAESAARSMRSAARNGWNACRDGSSRRCFRRRAPVRTRCRTSRPSIPRSPMAAPIPWC